MGKEIPYEKRKKYPQMSSAKLTTLFCPSTVCFFGEKKKKSGAEVVFPFYMIS